MNRTIRTFSGENIDVTELDINKIHIEDIAHALAQTPRFSGHLPEFYSVAQHCLEGLWHADDKLRWLLHDASEAYLIDMPTPIKRMFPEYKKLEVAIGELINIKFGVSNDPDPQIKQVDNMMFDWEWHSLMLRASNFPKIKCLSPKEAEGLFLEKFHELKKI